MIRAKVNTTSLERALVRLERELNDLPNGMLRLASKAAQELRDRDRYQDRTGKLRANTKASLTSTGANPQVTLEMDTHYASYVERLGYSRFSKVAKKLEKQIIRYAERRLTVN